ncbi:WxL domain-containing protein [Candidatus Chloroploca asiatica]|uniref:WxL domain-containing protein n=1 Tax=Candidatus Chloroploca asiatica TaxID=1506545 RepID=A0A2H3KTI6_9CHLR|nr:WxL domain-containing protein [Candidatus Chloroploca asiatica]PDV97172.1 hypothetical protein A9Q02_04490 [Candidatus Chloroploca asiatica]
MSRFTRIFASGLGIAAALALSVAPAAHADTGTGVSMTLTGGSLAATLAGATLEPLSYSNAAQSTTGTVGLTVDDGRGSGAGWNVTIEASALTGGLGLGADSLSVTSASTPAATAGQAVNPTSGPLAIAPVDATLDTARRVISADAGFGQGIYTQVLGLRLDVPAYARAGTYTGTLTVTSASGPGV